MNFQQLRYVRAAVQNHLNLTEVANVLYTSQSGVSKQIKELEAELGIEIFVRRGKRLVGVTKAGEKVIAVIEKLLAEADNLKSLSAQYKNQDKGRLVIAATHNQARYALPEILLHFTRLYPEVEVELRQGTPRYVVETLQKGIADIGLATEALDDFPDLETFPCFTWNHVVAVLPGHPLTRIAKPTLVDISAYPIITYNPNFTGRPQIDAAFERAGLSPNIRLTAMDADVIKTYVRLGMGVGIISEMAMSEQEDSAHPLVPVTSSSDFFDPSVTKIAYLKGTLLRNYAAKLIELFAPHVDYAVLSGTARRSSNRDPMEILPFSQRLDLLHSPVGAMAKAN
jgi:LysR family cys regulon transcriptional activator